jgi:putative transposase
MRDKIDNGAGAPPRRKGFLRPEGGPSPVRPVPHRHLAHVASFRDSPIVFFTACTAQRRKLLACSQCHEILRTIWDLSAAHDGWWVGHYILMPYHVHFFARPEVVALGMAGCRCGKASAHGASPRRLGSSSQSGRRITSIAIFRSSENYSEKWHYVERNAARAGLVETVEAWPYR